MLVLAIPHLYVHVWICILTGIWFVTKGLKCVAFCFGEVDFMGIIIGIDIRESPLLFNRRGVNKGPHLSVRHHCDRGTASARVESM